MMSSKIIFSVLVVVIAAAVTAAVMMQPTTDEAISDGGRIDEGPRAEVQASTAPIGLAVGNRAPGWSLVDSRGQSRQLADYLGQVVVMDFWATWCGPCKMVMPDLQELHEQYESRGVRVLGMNGSERGGNPAQFMADNKYTYGLLLNSERVMSLYEVRGIPAIYVVGVDGTILYKHVGVLPNLDQELASIIEPHLVAHGL